MLGVVGSSVKPCMRLGCRLGQVSRKRLERRAIQGDSPVGENLGAACDETRVLRNLRESVGISENLLVRLNIVWRPIAKQYREGKVKSMPARQVKQNLKPCAYKQSEGYAAIHS